MQFRPLSETKFINDDNLVAYCPLENLTDVKGGFNLTNENTVAFNPAKFNNGADTGTSNTNKRLYVSSSLGLSNTDAVTISCWVKVNTEISSGIQTFVGKNISGNPFTQYRIEYNYNSGTRQIVFGINSSGGYRTVALTQTMGTTAYYHLLMTYSGGTTGTITGYVNGAFIGTNTAAISAGAGATTALNIGALASTELYASAIVDDVSVFSRALSSAEVNELYQGMTYGEYLGAGSATTKLLLHLNGNSTDSSGNGNNGIDTNIAYVDGKFGKCASFNGSSSGIATANTTSVSGLSAITVSTWINPASLASTDKVFLSHGISTEDSTWYCRVNTDGKIAFFVEKDGSNYSYLLSNASAIAINNWYNITMTWSGATSMALYVNGQAVAGSYSNGGTGATSMKALSAPIRLGNNQGNSLWYNGLQDECLIENRAWTPQEVAKRYAYAKGYYATL